MRWLAALFLLCVGVCSAQVGPQTSAPPAHETPSRILVLLRLPVPHYRPDGNYGAGYGDGMGHAARRRIAEQLAREQGLMLDEDWPMPLAGVDCYVMRVPPDVPPDSIAASLSRDARVAWAQVMRTFQAQAHFDPLYMVQPAARDWHLAELHARATGRAVKVAVIDSGVEVQHPDLVGQVLLSENFVDAGPTSGEQHGTGVAGIIAARADNGIGIVGVAPQARLLALRACWPESQGLTLCSSLTVAKALHYAIEHAAQVINLSFSGPEDHLLARLLDVARARGIAVIAAFDRAHPPGGFPATYPGVIAVADQAPGSLPPSVVRAPGLDIPTTVPGGGWYLVSGSSYAAAHVSGLLALLYELDAYRGQFETRSAIVLSASGVDSCATLSRAVGARVCACAAQPATSSLH